MSLDTDLTALVNTVVAWGTSISDTATEDGTVPDDLAAARASAAQAANSQSDAAGSVPGASSSASAATQSASDAASSEQAAAASATAAAGSVTTAGNNATTAATNATAAGTHNTVAQGYAARAAALAQTPPNFAITFVDGSQANYTWPTTLNFTAPMNGWIFAVASFNVGEVTSIPYTCSLLFNGASQSADATLTNQTHVGYATVTKGEAMTVSFNVSLGNTASGEDAEAHLIAWFIPGTI